MPDNTQKQIAAKYKDNLTYYKQGHYLRRWRFWLSVLAVLGGLVWAIGYQQFGGSPEFFNPGPISQNHQRFAQDCGVCHEGATTDLFAMLPTDKSNMNIFHGKTSLLEGIKSTGNRLWENTGVADAVNNQSLDKLKEAAHSALSRLDLDNIDHACLKCHEGMSLHQPGVKAVMLRETTRELSVVQADACSSCHQEHIGATRMKLPTSETCVSCHSDEQKLKASLKRIPYDGKLASIHSQNRQLGDLIQWLPATEVGAKPAVIRGFTDGHPAFLYEAKDSKDTAAIKFNHARHFASDIPKFQGRDMTCTDCHQPDAAGTWYL